MLFNIINTITLTASLGTSVAFNNQRQTRSTIAFNRTMNYVDTSYKYQEYGTPIQTQYTTKYMQLQNYYYYGDNMTINVRRITLQTMYRNGANDSVHIPVATETSQNGMGRTLVDANGYQVPIASELYFIKMEADYGLNQLTTILQEIFSLQLQYTTRAYIEFLSTTYDLQRYTNANINMTDSVLFGIYTENNNLYDKFLDIKLNETNYQTQVLSKNQSIGATGTSVLVPVSFTTNKTNYMVAYIQPYYVDADNTSGYKTQSNNVFLSAEDNPNYQIVGTNTIRLTGSKVIIDGNIEVIDLPGVMFTVLGMPFTFISTAFNLTLFPGTAYEVNISMLFLAIFAVLVFVFILKLILSKVK